MFYADPSKCTVYIFNIFEEFWEKSMNELQGERRYKTCM